MLEVLVDKGLFEKETKTVIDALAEYLSIEADEDTLTMVRTRRLAVVSRHLLALADDESIGSKTTRLTVAAAAE